MVNIEPAAAFKAEKVDAWGPGLKSDGVVAGKRCTFTIDTRRAVKLAVQCIDEDQEPVDVEVKDNEDGTYSCSYVPVKHHRRIMYITYDGSSDRNSPFIKWSVDSGPKYAVVEDVGSAWTKKGVESPPFKKDWTSVKRSS
ncbi:hypothetical protein BaRGS_00031739 [Batillaria attramentaria]|uniref:Uncharacterized protein n=1 Tax=Batillaria attramentaria TaxID=370345 RepID=A0ABD0JQV4_9CAEN